MKRHRYSLTIATPSGQTQDESVRTLRAFLKQAIRCYGIVCVSAVQIDATTETTPQDASESTFTVQDDIRVI